MEILIGHRLLARDPYARIGQFVEFHDFQVVKLHFGSVKLALKLDKFYILADGVCVRILGILEFKGWLLNQQGKNLEPEISHCQRQVVVDVPGLLHIRLRALHRLGCLVDSTF